MNLISRLALNFICKKNSKKLSFTSLVSIVGICFGVSAFLVVITVLNSFQAEIKNIISTVNPNLIVFSQYGIQDVKTTEKELKKLIKAPVEGMSPFIYQESVMGLGRQTSSVYIKAIQGTKSASANEVSKFIYPKSALETLNVSSKLIDQYRNTLDAGNNPALLPHVILGKELADDLDAKIGSIVTLMTFGAGKSALGVRYNKLYVTGIASTGLSEYDRKNVFMNFQDGVNLFGSEGWASGVEIKLKNSTEALQVSKDLHGKTPYNIVAWQDIDTSLFEQIERDGTSIKLIVLIISFVAGFNIIVALSLTVIDRSKQIALLRALGAKKTLIISTFVFSGLFLGILGSTLGVFSGLVLLKVFSGISLGDFQKFYYLEKIPVQIDTQLIIFAFLTSILLSFFGALYPAWRASKVSPMHGLKQGN
ncbi:FtsX-like permease family protein [Fluviispira multicolorata]|uniref:FtsX-like permease family protein n=1 Tax=Fluviispira multicolorata TaxID=2654512 RepID=UPI001375D5C1|nr:FtsX-like permease family protein [Fluviispira multicolorata]